MTRKWNRNILFYAHRESFIKNWLIPLRDHVDFNIFVFHINRLNGDAIPLHEGIELIDISNLGCRQIEAKMREIDPAAVVFLGYRSLIELLMLRICKRSGFPSVFLEHGLYTKDTNELNKSALTSRSRETVAKYANFIGKYLGWIFRRGPGEICILYDCFFRKDYSRSFFDKALFISTRGRNGLNPILKVPDADVQYCGYPIFADARDKLAAKDGEGGALYVHQPFILKKQTGIGYEDERGYMIQLKDHLQDKFGNLTLLLHPRENLSNYRLLYKQTGIEVIQKPNDPTVFSGRSLVIGHYSTALLVPLHFGIRTIVLDYPGTKIDDLFSQYCEYYHDICDIPSNERDARERKADIFDLLGPENTFEHVGDLINNLCAASFAKAEIRLPNKITSWESIS